MSDNDLMPGTVIVCAECDHEWPCHHTPPGWRGLHPAVMAIRGRTEAALLAEALKLPKIKALVEAVKPYVSPVQNADFGRQMRQHDALVAALRAIGEASHENG